MLDIIETRMLAVDVGERINAAQCVSALEEASSQIGTDSSDQIQRVAQRALPGILEDESQEEVTSVRSSHAEGSMDMGTNSNRLILGRRMDFP